MRERLIELIDEFRQMDAPNDGRSWSDHLADYLLAEGVIVPPKKTSQEKLWEKNAERLCRGEFGNLYGEECYVTMLRYWKAQEQAGHPYASDNVKCFELMIAERSKR